MKANCQDSVVSARIPAEIRRKIETFAAQHELSRSDAISFLISQGLIATEAATHEPVLPLQSFV
jgi:hypothetical protein